MTTTTQHIFLLRHLKTEANRDKVIMGRLMNPPVLEQSIPAFQSYIKLLKKEFPELSNDAAFYSSPALRCQQTIKRAMIELSQQSKTIHTDDRLQETDLGKFSGLNAQQIREKYPDLIDVWMKHPENIVFPDGESYHDVQKRAWEWFQSILTLPHKAIVAATHVDVIKMILFKNLGIPIANKRLVVINTGSATIFDNRGKEVVLIGTNLYSS